jgi:hypothetical protein
MLEPLTDAEKIQVLERLGMEGLLPHQLAYYWPPECAELYRHKKGGVYRKLMEADDGETVVYEHLWPYACSVRTRPKVEFEEPGRFERITS